MMSNCVIAPARNDPRQRNAGAGGRGLFGAGQAGIIKAECEKDSAFSFAQVFFEKYREDFLDP